MTLNIVQNDSNHVSWHFSDLIGCALGTERAVDSAQQNVFLTILFVKLESWNFVRRVRLWIYKKKPENMF